MRCDVPDSNGRLVWCDCRGGVNQPRTQQQTTQPFTGVLGLQNKPPTSRASGKIIGPKWGVEVVKMPKSKQQQQKAQTQAQTQTQAQEQTKLIKSFGRFSNGGSTMQVGLNLVLLGNGRQAIGFARYRGDSEIPVVGISVIPTSENLPKLRQALSDMIAALDGAAKHNAAAASAAANGAPNGHNGNGAQMSPFAEAAHLWAQLSPVLGEAKARMIIVNGYGEAMAVKVCV